ncbi:hypothetical protein QCD71_20535 [Sphingomonas sp. PsM26]|jgi:hypothetical protein|nr:hypothetical protein [Sphingomonas sp. PsM26]
MLGSVARVILFGCRTNEVRVRRGSDQRDQRFSTVDLFTEGLTLVSANARRIEVARSVSQATGIAIGAVHIGSDIPLPGRAQLRSDVRCVGGRACLVRPDAIVAWRAPGMDTDPERELSRVLT